MKKFYSLALVICILLGQVFAEAPVFLSSQMISIYERYGFTIEDASDSLPESPGVDEVEYHLTATLKLAGQRNLSASLQKTYDAVDGAWVERGQALNFLYSTDGGRESYAKILRDLLNDGFTTGLDLPFYTASLAFLMASHSELTDLSAKTVLNQILVQGDINDYFAESSMISYAENTTDSAEFDAAADAKNLVYGGRKYLLILRNNGYILSSRPTNEADSIVLSASPTPVPAAETVAPSEENASKSTESATATPTAAAESTATPAEATDASNETTNESDATTSEPTETDAAATAKPGVTPSRVLEPINKQYGWDNLKQILYDSLGTKFLPNQASTALGITAEQITPTQVELFFTGAGAMLSYENVNATFLLNTTGDSSDILRALKKVVENFLTMDSYARIAGSDGLYLKVHFDSVQSYSIENITDLAELLNRYLQASVLLGEDEAVLASTESLTTIADKPLGITGAEAETTPQGTVLLPAESTTTTSSKYPGEGQLEVVKKKVNIRDAPGGKIKFRVVRGNILNIIGPAEKYNGWHWFFIEYNGETGYARHDTVKVLDYVVATPTPVPATEGAESNTSTVDTSYTTLSRGSSGNEVLTLQIRLIELGYLSGTGDGKFGARTESAVKAAQKAFNQQQSGKADAAFQTALFAENAINAQTASVMASDPANMGLHSTALINAENYMKKRYGKTVNGYTTGVSLTDVDSRLTLTASSANVDNTSYEVVISATTAQGALNIDPRFELRIINLNVQDVNRIELVRGKKITELPSNLWTIENGMVKIDLTLDTTALTSLLDTRITKDIVFYSPTTSYTLDFAPATGPQAVTKYMQALWKTIEGAKIAEAAEYLRKNTTP